MDPPNFTEDEYLIRHYSIEDGLPVNSANGMVQDKNGYLYISTHDGLVRFDGYDFKVYNSGNTKGMVTNRIAGIIKTEKNGIWLFNENGSVTLKSGDSFQTFSEPEVPGHIHRLIRDTNDRVWVAGPEGIAYYDEKSTIFKRLSGPLFNSGSELIGEGINGGIFAVTDSGLVSWNNGVSERLLSVKDFPVKKNDILALVQLEEETLWVLGRGCFFLLSLESNEIEALQWPEDRATSFWGIYQKGESEYLLNGSDDYYTFNLENNALKRHFLTIHSPTARTELIFEGNSQEEILIGDDEVIIDGKTVLEAPSIKFGFLDNEGSIWIGSETQGLFQIRKSSFINLTTSTSPGFNNIYSIIEDEKGNHWTCSLNSGINRISQSGIQHFTTTNDTYNMTQCAFLFIDRKDQSIYAGLNNDIIMKYSGEEWEVFLKGEVPESTLSLVYPEAMLRKGQILFIGHLGPLIKYDEINGFRPFDTENLRELSGIQTFAVTSDEVIFAGTSGNGLYRIEGNSYSNYTADEGFLTSDIIRDIFLQSDDTLWLATENLGLNRLVMDKAGEVLSTKSITTSDGLFHNSLHRIIEDNFGNLWISSNGGIMRVSKSDLNNFADEIRTDLPVLSFDRRDGMINREANGGKLSAGILASDGRIWFPNQRGVTIINPADFLSDENRKPLYPVFETLETRGVEYQLTDQPEIELHQNQRDLKVNFTAPNFVNQDRVNFSYYLEGVNEQWLNATDSREAVFTEVPPGNHELKIRSQFIGGSVVEKSIMLIVPPYFYETTWFGVLVFLGLIVLIYSGVRLRVRKLEESERKLKKRVDIQTRELKEAVEQKQQFFTGITHDLKTPLSLIIGPLDDLAEKPIDGPDKKISNKAVMMMHRNSHRLKNLVDQILDVSKLNAGAIKLKVQPVDLVKFTRQIVGQFQSKLEQEDVLIDLPSISFEEPVYVDAEAWERVIINLMNNAIRFSPKKGTIRLGFTEYEQYVEVVVKDEGRGIKPEYQEKIFEYLYQIEGSKASEGTGVGLYLVKGLLKEIGGSISVNPEEEKGAEFIVSLRKGYGHIESRHELIHELFLSEEKSHGIKVKANSDSSGEKPQPFEHQILIVEDNYDFRGYLKSILENEYEVLLAANGKDAFSIISNKTPSLIISDIMMPEMNGLEFVNALRSKKQFKHLPVIFLSARNEELDVQTGLSTGADIYLTKPIRKKTLISQITAVLRREQILKNKEYDELTVDEDELIKQVREIVYRQLANPSLSVNHLADALFVSRAKLYNDWKNVSEVSLNDFMKQIRLNEAKILLKERGFNAQETARAVGYSSQAYFSTSFKKYFGISPSEV